MPETSPVAPTIPQAMAQAIQSGDAQRARRLFQLAADQDALTGGRQAEFEAFEAAIGLAIEGTCEGIARVCRIHAPADEGQIAIVVAALNCLAVQFPTNVARAIEHELPRALPAEVAAAIHGAVGATLDRQNEKERQDRLLAVREIVKTSGNAASFAGTLSAAVDSGKPEHVTVALAAAEEFRSTIEGLPPKEQLVESALGRALFRGGRCALPILTAVVEQSGAAVIASINMLPAAILDHAEELPVEEGISLMTRYEAPIAGQADLAPELARWRNLRSRVHPSATQKGAEQPSPQKLESLKAALLYLQVPIVGNNSLTLAIEDAVRTRRSDLVRAIVDLYDSPADRDRYFVRCDMPTGKLLMEACRVAREETRDPTMIADIALIPEAGHQLTSGIPLPETPPQRKELPESIRAGIIKTLKTDDEVKSAALKHLWEPSSMIAFIDMYIDRKNIQSAIELADKQAADLEERAWEKPTWPGINPGEVLQCVCEQAALRGNSDLIDRLMTAYRPYFGASGIQAILLLQTANDVLLARDYAAANEFFLQHAAHLPPVAAKRVRQQWEEQTSLIGEFATVPDLAELETQQPQE